MLVFFSIWKKKGLTHDLIKEEDVVLENGLFEDGLIFVLAMETAMETAMEMARMELISFVLPPSRMLLSRTSMLSLTMTTTTTTRTRPAETGGEP